MWTDIPTRDRRRRRADSLDETQWRRFARLAYRRRSSIASSANPGGSHPAGVYAPAIRVRPSLNRTCRPLPRL